MAEIFANSEDLDQTWHSAASDLVLHCLPITLLWVSGLQWVKYIPQYPVTLYTESKCSGPSCSKLTPLLVNDSLKFKSSDTQIC